MNKYDLSIVLPGIRVQNWVAVYNSIATSCQNYNWEVIFVGPYPPVNELWNKTNIKYVRDLGSPCRCYQIGSYLAEGKYICGGSDDGLYELNALDKAMEYAITMEPCDIMCLKYCEGPLRSGKCPDDSYWVIWNHADGQLAGIPKNYKTAPVHLIERHTFIDFGGFDTRFEMINCSQHCLSFRIQKAGGNVLLSPTLVLSCDYETDTSLHAPIVAAYHQNDLPLMRYLYGQPNWDRIKIDFDNWRNTPNIWSRRFRIN